jgi:hypothetical protein
MKPRFTIRVLLILTACLAAFCYWRDRPRQIANQFVAAIESGDYKLAESMFKTHYSALTTMPPPRPPYWVADPLGQGPSDWFAGRYPLRVYGWAIDVSVACYMNATATGIEPVGKWHVTPQVSPRPAAGR